MPLPSRKQFRKTKSYEDAVMETKGFETSFELKTSDDGVFEGHGAVFNKPDEFGDIIMPGAFKKSLRTHGRRKVKMFLEHDRTKLLGVWEQLKEDGDGLFVKGRLLLELQTAKEVFILMKEGVLDSLSIGFRTILSQFDSKREGRNILELKLFEVSLVSIPAQMAALITNVKNVSPEDIETKGDLERVLRDVGISKSVSRFIVAGWTPPARRDAEGGTELVSRISAVTKSLRTATGVN